MAKPARTGTFHFQPLAKGRTLLTGLGKSVCYEVLPFVMDCKLAGVNSESGKHSASCCIVLSLFHGPRKEAMLPSLQNRPILQVSDHEIG